MQKFDAYIIDAVRTPIGKYGGIFKDIRADDLGAIPIQKILERNLFDTQQIDDIYFGCANQSGEDNRNVARMSSLLAQVPYSVPAVTINRLCGSSLEAINMAAKSIWCGDVNLLIAGGVESMSRAPYSIPKNQTGKYGNVVAFDTSLGWRYPNPKMEKMFPLESMGETAENIAEKFQIKRELQDEFAFNSHKKSINAILNKKFLDEIIPIEIETKNGINVISIDEGPRSDTTIEKLSTLKPIFRKNGTVTAGNSSSLNDGASAVLIASEKKASEFNFKPIAKIISVGTYGIEPQFMGLGPISATKIALKKANLKISDIDLIELNEAFAAQSLAVIQELDIDINKVNINGGAIAIGHPLGASGSRIITTLVHELKRQNKKYGLATMCIGVGQGISTIIQNV